MTTPECASNCANQPDEATAPLDTLEQLLEWRENSVDRCLIGQPLQNVVEKGDKNRPRTLVCHDMAGGYLEDRFAHGCVAESVYYLREWPYIDVFVYFSHHFVTIPPVGWINAAHTHNVSILGTIITEWNDGEKICDDFLSDGTKLVAVAEQLAKIAAKYNFDGWLLNVENPITHVGNLISFVGLLTTKCKEIVGPKATVIWYDSVTASGQLTWQDALNEQNKCYFDVCDGIFLNYGWTEQELDTSVLQAGDRVLDVYVGVDVFGRGCMGGGGFNCYEPLNCIRQRGLSMALFAPGWVYERLNKAEFEINQRRFWSMIAPGLHCNKIVRLPFSTSFVPGKRWYPSKIDPDGAVIDRCFFSLRDQELQPHWFCPRDDVWPTKDENGERLAFLPRCSISYFTHDYASDHPAGAVLKSVVKDRDNRLRLFCCDLEPDRPIRISITYQAKESDVQAGLAITCQSKEDQSVTYVLPDTLDNKRVESILGIDCQVKYCAASTLSIRADVRLMTADLLLTKEERLTAIDLLILAMCDQSIDCTIISFSLNYVD